MTKTETHAACHDELDYSDEFTETLKRYRELKIEAANELIAMSEAELHATASHPNFDYMTTHGPRKGFDREDAPPAPGWVRNVHRGRNGWERFDYHEESYWMQLRPGAGRK